MFTGFEKIVEDRIRKAQKKGAFENLAGSGEPLRLEDDQLIAEDLRMAYKILKNADCTPPEIDIRKKIVATEQLLAGMKDTAERYRTIKKLNVLIMRLNLLRESRVDMDMPQQYEEKLADRFSSKPERTASK